MTQQISPKGLSRRALLARATAAGACFVCGAGFIAAADAAWALEMRALAPQSFATLVQMARDIYPHDQIADEYYVVAVKGYDTPENAADIEAGIRMLNDLARAQGDRDYLSIGWERERVHLLRRIEDSAFFQRVRGGLVTGLYNQKAIWPIFGYEGESFSKGGYIERGFNDITWL